MKGYIVAKFDLTLGGQRVKHTNTAFALGPRKTIEKLGLVGRSPEFPDAN